MNRFLIAAILSCCLCAISFPSYAADVPENISLSSTEDSITLSWDGDSDADTYNVYWGTASDNLNQTASVTDPTTEFTITGLTAGNEYFIAVSSVDNSVESERSAVQSITTSEDTEAPESPTGFKITAVSDITETSARFKWDENSESDMDKYTIYHGSASETYNTEITVDAGRTTKTVSALTRGNRYFFTITAVDSSGNESAQADELIVDTKPDDLAPDTPAGISGGLTGAGTLKVSVDSGNQQMVDFAGNNIYYGTRSGVYDYSIDIENSGSHVFSELPEDKRTWYFAASAYDQPGNESGRTNEISIEIEDTKMFLNDADFDGGCFVNTTGAFNPMGFIIGSGAFLLMIGLAVLRRQIRLFLPLVLIVAFFAADSSADQWEKPGPNTLGVTVGYYVPQDSGYEDFYDDNSFPVSAFYDRHLHKYFSIEIKGGYFQDSGRLLTVSGKETAIKSKMEMAPASASLKLHLPIADYITGYVGLGPDYWYVKEEPKDDSTHEAVEEWVGGYHGKIGFMFYNTDDSFQGTGALIETGYSVVDRFGDNGTDLGGWITEFGLFYQF